MAMRWYWFGWLAVFWACSDTAPQKQGSVPPPGAGLIVTDTVRSTSDTASAPLDTALGSCNVVFEVPSPEQQGVIEAVKVAYGLEGVLFQQRGTLDTISREEVYAHYRQGFGEDLAQQLTDYSWQPESRMLRATDPALTIPDSVGVLELKRDHALVAWIPPTIFRRQWGVPRCLIDRMVREDGRWIVQAR